MPSSSSPMLALSCQETWDTKFSSRNNALVVNESNVHQRTAKANNVTPKSPPVLQTFFFLEGAKSSGRGLKVASFSEKSLSSDDDDDFISWIY